MPPATQQVAIVTDSSVSLPGSLAEEWGIQVAPLEVQFGDRAYRDGEDLGPAAFYQMLQTAGPLPTTSAPKPASFLAAFQRASSTARHVVCLTLAARFSATYESARAAAELARTALPEVTIQVVDTHTATGAEALVALAAAKAARQGRGPEEVMEVCYSVMERVNLIAFLDTLRFVWRSGRIPWMAAWMGDVLRVKPMLELKEGDVWLVARPRSRARATERLLKGWSGVPEGGRWRSTWCTRRTLKERASFSRGCGTASTAGRGLSASSLRPLASTQGQGFWVWPSMWWKGKGHQE